MLQPTYRQALSHAWHLVWHNKILWIFGLLSVLLGQFGLNNFVGQLAVLADREAISVSESWWPASWPVIQITTIQGLIWFIWLILIFVAVAALFVLLAVAAQGALIDASAHWFKNHTTATPAKAWNKGIKHFWRLFLLNVIQKLLSGFVLLAVIFFLSVISSDSVGGFLLTVLALSLGVMVILMLSAIFVYAAGYIVEEEKSFWYSVKNGWDLFSRHLLVSLELSIIFVLFNVVLVAVILLGSLLVLAPAVLIWLLAGATGYIGLLTVGLVLAIFLFILLVVFSGAVFNAFTTCAWMYFFMKMHHEGIASRVLHYMRRAVHKQQI